MASDPKPTDGEERELDIALEREATRDILSVISQSRDDDQRVFDLIVQHASHLCDARPVVLNMLNEARTHVRFVAKSDSMKSDSFVLGQEFDVREGRIRKQVIDQGEVLHVPDMAATQGYAEGDEWHRATVDREGVRTMLSVPLISGGRAIGFLMLIRREVRPFADDEITLVQTFAAQAVIAIENVRQFRELQTRLEREEASRRILDVISRSRDDEKPVFEVILDNAARLCHAQLAFVTMVNDERTHLHLKAHKGDSFPGFVDTLNRTPMPLDANEAETARCVLERRTIHIEDLRSGELYRRGQPHRISAVEDGGIRTLLIVPLVSRDVGIGTLNLWRAEESPFSDDEVALVEGFAAQAVIAIENVRQFRELQTRLQREAASREILGVISRSRDNEQPVFDIILKNAANLCHAPLATLTMVNEERTHLEYVTHWGEPIEIFSSGKDRWALDVDRVVTRAVNEKLIIQLEDIADSDLYRQGDRVRRLLVDVEGIHTLLVVPLVRGDEAIGAVILHRYEVRAFSEAEIQLVETFAAQAVIAIDNVRQFRTVIAARDDAERALADLRKAQERLVQSEKMASLGQLTAGIAHEIKNPLNFINNFAKLTGELLAELGEILEEPIAALDAEDREDAEELFRTARENLGKISHHGRRADGIVKNMLLHSREGPSLRQTAKPNSIAAEALNLAYHGARAENPSFTIEMNTDFGEEVGTIECYPQDLMRVFLNIISNGMYAAYKRGLKEDGFAPEIAVASRRDGDRVEVEVRDNGDGIPPEAREKIFTPFFTTKPAGEGTGLGLSLSYDIVVKQHGGDLTVESEPGRFTTFTVSLPQTPPSEN